MTWADLLPKEEHTLGMGLGGWISGFNDGIRACVKALEQAQTGGQVCILPSENELMRIILELMPLRYEDAVEPLARAILEKLKEEK